MGDVIALRGNQKGRGGRPRAVIADLQALARDGKLPLPERLILERVAGRHHPRLMDIWAAHQKERHPYIKGRTFDEIVALASAPSQLYAIVASFRIHGQEVETLAGHYAMDDRERHIELCFDRSFIEKLGLHRLSIDYRLYTAALSLVVGGRARDVVPLYASIYEKNERSRKNYRNKGAVERSYLPRCLRRDGISANLTIEGVRFSIFPPDAVLAAFSRMLEVLRVGRMKVGDRDVLVEMRGGEIADPKIAERLLPLVRRMCEIQARFSRRRKYSSR